MRNGSNTAGVAPDLELDGWLERFEAAAAAGPDPDPAAFLPDPAHPQYGPALREMLRLDLEFAWARGEERRVEAYADRFPTLFEDPSALAEVALEEYRQRRAAGEDPDPAEYRQRLAVTLPVPGRAPSGPVATWDGSRLPEPGEVVPPGYRIITELGRGAFGRVYLAEQADLANRKVAVKISSRLIGEAQTLARLQHTHIVPVYSVHRVQSYQVLVMPYLGGTTLADVLAAGRAVRSGRVTEKPIRTEATTEPGDSGPLAPGPDRPTDARPLTEAEVLAVGIAIADGLAHAHGRGILHRDIKPANILLTGDGAPMLLDFNLAADDQGETGSAGGTPRYMAPEQLEALRDPAVRVDGRADVYGLGIVLHELFTGRSPFPDRSGTWAEIAPVMLADRRPVPAVTYPSPAIAAILRTALEPDPARRYASAADLRDDLVCQRDHRRLRTAREPVSRERVRKWARRHPRLSSATTVATVAAAVLALLAWAAYSAWRGNQELQAREGRAEVARARDDVRPLVADPHAPDRQFHQARQRALAALAPYDLPNDPNWIRSPKVERLPADAAQSLRADVAVLLAYLAEATAYLAVRQPDAVARGALLDEALVWNEQAAAAYPSAEPVWHLVKQRQWLLERTGGTAEARSLADVAARATRPPQADEYLRAVTDLRDRRYREAAEALEKVVARGPADHRAWMELGAARLHLYQYDRAADAFLAAGAIAPEKPWPPFYRGVALLEAGRPAAAIASLDRFLAANDREPDAWVNRAIAHIRLKQWPLALQDLDEAEKRQASPTRLHALRSQAHRGAGRMPEAAAERRRALDAAPRGIDDWTIRGETRLPDDPAGAVRDFDAALAIEPDYPAALRGKASALSEQLQRPADAATVLGRLVATAAATVEDRAGYSVLLARLGRVNEARQQARACLEAGTPAVPLYQAASALALTATTADDRREALAVLRRVIQADASWAKEMPTDPDLKNVRGEAEFQELMIAARALTGTGR